MRSRLGTAVAWTLDTLRRAARSPSAWGLAVCGLVAGWAGIALSVLALGAAEAQAASLLLATGQAWAVILVLWVLTRLLEEDRASAFTAASDAARPGRGGRLLGRWGGSVLAAAPTAALVASLPGWIAGAPAPNFLCLFLTSIVLAAVAGAWALLVGGAGGGPWPFLVVLGLWAVGHLPFGAPGVLGGRVGRVVGAVLPGPLPAAPSAGSLLGSALVVAGLLLLALAIATRGMPVPAARLPARTE